MFIVCSTRAPVCLMRTYLSFYQHSSNWNSSRFKFLMLLSPFFPSSCSWMHVVCLYKQIIFINARCLFSCRHAILVSFSLRFCLYFPSLVCSGWWAKRSHLLNNWIVTSLNVLNLVCFLLLLCLNMFILEIWFQLHFHQTRNECLIWILNILNVLSNSTFVTTTMQNQIASTSVTAFRSSQYERQMHEKYAGT